MPVKPVTPEEALSGMTLPDEVMKTWNTAVTKAVQGNGKVNQDDIVDALMAATGRNRQFIFDEGWLDVENIYRNVGFDVEYHRPTYDENWEAYFIFKVGKKT